MRDVVDRMRAVVDGSAPEPQPGEEVPAAVTALADLWERTTPNAAPHWRTRFAWHVARHFVR
ncbi:terpene cyclase [Streptomyces californicus]